MTSLFNLLISLFFLPGFLAPKMPASPISWKFEVKKISATSYDLVFRAAIPEGVHMYSQHVPEDGPIPTSFNFIQGGNYKLVDSVIEKSKAEKIHDKNFDMDLLYYSGTAEFVQHIEITGAGKKVKGQLEFMCCDATKCFPPEKVDFEFDLPD